MKTSISRVFLALVLMLTFGTVGATAQIIPIGAHFAGQLTGAIVGDSLQITAHGQGSSPHAPVTAEATWAPKLSRILQLVTGQIKELPIGNGTFSADTEEGNLSGSLAGVIYFAGPTHYRLDAKFEVTDGTGQFTGATGSGHLRAIVNLVDHSFTAELNVILDTP